VEVVNGEVQRGVRTMLRDVGPMERMGFTRDGDLIYWIRTFRFSIHLAPFDSETGAVDRSVSKPLVGMKSNPDWSPDGRFLTYWHKKDRAHAAEYDQVLGITDLETGEERELAPHLEVEWPRWSMDGESILALAVERAQQDSIGPAMFSIDPWTGEAEELLRFERDPAWYSRIGAVPAVDGRDFVYVQKGRVVLHDVMSGEETELYRHPGLTMRPLAPSPDGRHLVFAVVDSMTWSGIGSERPGLGDGYGRLMLMRLLDGEMQELLALDPQTRIETVDWGPEGRYLYFDWYEADDTRAMKRIPIEGGEPEVVWSPAFGRFSLSPTGDRMAFTRFVQESDVYLMENLRAVLQDLDRNR
jgi:Tol biopolymer transport system component